MRLPEINFDPKDELKWEPWRTDSFRAILDYQNRLVFVIDKAISGFYLLSLYDGRRRVEEQMPPRFTPERTILGDHLGYLELKTAKDEARRWLTAKLKAQGKWK